METYIRKNIPGYFIEFPEEIDSVYWEGKIGTTWQDFEDGKWVHLSSAQVAFYNEHPQATVKEVWDMEIIPCPEPTPEPTPQPEPSSQYTLVDLSENLSSEEKASIIANLGLNIEPEQVTLEDLSNNLTEQQRTSIISNLGLADSKTIEESGQNHTLQPNIHYDLGEAERLEFTLGTPIEGITNRYSFSFDSPQNKAALLILPQSIIWSSMPQIKEGHHYEIDIIYNTYNDVYYGKINEW